MSVNEKFYQFEITGIVRHGHDKAALTLRPQQDFAYRAGQYVELSFISALPSRPYSIASAPSVRDSGSTSIEIHVKDGGHGAGSHHAVHEAKVGDIVFGRGPYGSCVYDHTGLGEIVLVAGGMGITPLKSILEEAIAQNHPHKIHLFWSAKEVEDLYLQSHFFTLKNKYNLLNYIGILESNFAIGGSGFLDSVGAGATYFLSGPRPMIEAAAIELIGRGVSPTQLKSDMVGVLRDIIQKHRKVI